MKALKIGVVSALAGVIGLVLSCQTVPRTEHVVKGSITTVAKIASNVTWAIAAGKDGSLYYADGHQLRQILSSGSNRLVIEMPDGPRAFIRDIAVAPDGTVFLTDDTEVVRHYANGTLTTIARSQGVGRAAG